MVAGYWAVAQTRPQNELIAVARLNRHSHEAYCPIIVKRVGHKRKYEVRRPLFVGYVFVRIIHQWYSILSGFGLSRLLMTEEGPAKLEDAFVDNLRERECDGVVQLPVPCRFHRGERVFVKSGPMQGVQGLYDGAGSARCERVLLNMLGRLTPVLVNIDDLEACR